MAYRATDTAFVECVDGNPYSNAADPDIVILCNGGDIGLGRHKMSLMIPETITPAASKFTNARPNS